MSIDDAIRWVWAKSGDDGETSASGTHPLVCHLIDAGAVAEALWDVALAPATRALIARAFHGNHDAARRGVITLAAVHDIGKATPAFAQRHPASRDLLADHGLTFGEFATETDHARLGGYLLRVHRARIVDGADPAVATCAAEIIAGHHGAFRPVADLNNTPEVLEGAGLRQAGSGRGSWRAVQEAVLDHVSQAFLKHDGGWGIGFLDPDDRPARATIAGLLIVADWLASSQADFPYATGPTLPDPGGYLTGARLRARQVLDRLAWHDLPAPDPAIPFERLFGLAGGPNALQAATRMPRPNGPALVVVEAPMGLGKTEAALDLFDRAAREGGQTGLFVGLPTQATANGLFDRLAGFLRQRHPGSVANVQLLHGQAQLAAAFTPLLTDDATTNRDLIPAGIHDGAALAQEGAVVAAAWFQGRRRGLLASFGAGTVDQAMMTVLRTRFLPLRILGLAGKVVVIDEVHAYDVYMTTIIGRLLEWLGALDCTVILLSATLPSARRALLAEAFRAGLGRRVPGETPSLAHLAVAPYPRVTWVTADGTRTDAIALPGPSRLVRLIRRPEVMADPDAFGAWLAQQLADGGCAVVIATTVARAQAIHRGLLQWFPGDANDGDPVLDLFHARYPFAWREAIELRVRRRFGPPGRMVATPDGPTVPVRRPHRAVLVATQVVEQSLDLDFDLLVTEPAPGDLLLQRMGRVHRHQRDQRPAGLGIPGACLLQETAQEDGTPAYGRDQVMIYAESPLLRTGLALDGRDHLILPDDIDALVEATYADGIPNGTPDAWARRLRTADAALAAARQNESTEAEARLVPSPWSSGALADLTSLPNGGSLAEDDPKVNDYLRAQTRLGDETIAVVCLLDNGDRTQACGDPDGAHLPADVLETLPGGMVTRRLLRSVAAVSNWSAVKALRDTPGPAGWARHPMLRDARAPIFTPDPAGARGEWTATIAGHALHLSVREGLTVEPIRPVAARTEGVPPS